MATASPAALTGVSAEDATGLPSPGGRILVPILDETAINRAIELAATIARNRRAELLICYPVTAPGRTPYEHVNRTGVHREVAKHVFRMQTDPSTDVPVRGTVRVGRRAIGIIERMIDPYEVDTVVLERSRSDGTSDLRRDVVARITARTNCDVVVVSGEGHLDVSSVLVPVAGGPHAGRAIDVAREVATANDAWIDLLYVIDSNATERERADAEQYIATSLDRSGEFGNVGTWVLEADNVAAAIIEQSTYYDATVLGAPQKERLRRFVAGSTTDTVRSDASNSVITVRHARKGSWLGRWSSHGT